MALLRRSRAKYAYQCYECLREIKRGERYYRLEPHPMARLHRGEQVKHLCVTCVNGEKVAVSEIKKDDKVSLRDYWLKDCNWNDYLERSVGYCGETFLVWPIATDIGSYYHGCKPWPRKLSRLTYSRWPGLGVRFGVRSIPKRIWIRSVVVGRNLYEEDSGVPTGHFNEESLKRLTNAAFRWEKTNLIIDFLYPATLSTKSLSSGILHYRSEWHIWDISLNALLFL
jgi:hypothetical protein